MTDSLYIFLQGLFKSVDAKMKIATIGQSIFQAARPCVILAQHQLGFGVQLHLHFASKYLIDILNTHDFSCSYLEVTTYVAVSSGKEISNLILGNFIQYAADNVDHNIRTLDGYNVLHRRGMIATVKPGTSSTRTILLVTVKAEDIAAVGHVNIEHYMSECDSLQLVYYQKL